MEALLNKKPNQEILAHQAKRKVEVKVLELREAMEEDGNYDEEEIEVRKITDQNLFGPILYCQCCIGHTLTNISRVNVKHFVLCY